jgi:Xaa-Pro aminopeptidase
LQEPNACIAIAGTSADPQTTLFVAEHGRVPDVNLIESIHRLRWIKSSAECRLMRETCRIGSAALASTMIHSRPDMNENELVGRMEFEVRARGARSLAYPPVVAGGQRALIIHYLNADQVQLDSYYSICCL